MKSALIFGITGQAGSYLAELLLEKGYSVFGAKRRVSSNTNERIEHILPQIELIEADVTDTGSVISSIQKSLPDEVYNLAAQSTVAGSWKEPAATSQITGIGALNILEAIRLIKPDARFFQASSSEMFGKVVESPQKENTLFYPRSPYACAKVFAHYATINYRESFGMYAVSGINFNFESPRRTEEFVTKKIAKAVANIYRGNQRELKLGNIYSKRDWEYAKDRVYWIWKMLQQEKPEDFVLGTGETHSVMEFLELAFGYVGLNFESYVEYDESLIRPAEVDLLLADPSKAKRILGYETKTKFRDLVELMVEHELRSV